MDHSRRKPTDERYLMHVEAPFDSLDKVGATPYQVARNHDRMDLDDGSMYFNQPNQNWDSLEWIATEVPEEWVADIERLE